MYNKLTLRTLKEAFDWETYVEQNYIVKYANGRYGREIRICCPNCGEKDFKCYVNPEKKTFNCFKCSFRVGKDFDVISFIAMTESITKAQALMKLISITKEVTPEELHTPKEEMGTLQYKLEFPDVGTVAIPQGSIDVTPDTENPGWHYLSSRGFTDTDLAVTQAKYLPNGVRVKNAKGVPVEIGDRILFPIYGPDGKLVSWQARTIQPSIEPKYLTAPGSDLSSCIWPFSRPYDGSSAILVEGIIDALAVRRIPRVSSYAVFTKRISNDQITTLKMLGVSNVTLWFDKKDALKEMIRAVEVLKMHFKEVNVLDLSDWPSKLDAGSFLNNPDKIAETLEKKINVYELEYEQWKLSF